MIKIKNTQTGETKNVYNTEFVNGYVKNNTGKPLGKRFANSWAGILTETTDAEGGQVFTLSDEWQVIKGRTPKPVQPVVATEETIVAEDAAGILEPLTNTEAHAIEEAEVVEETSVVEAPVVDTPNTENNTEAEAPVEKPKKKRTPKPAANTAGEVASIDVMKAEMLARHGTKERDLCTHKIKPF